MLMFMWNRGRMRKGSKGFNPLSFLLSFMLVNLFMIHVYEAIKPSSPKVALKIWDFVHKAGRLWKNFLKMCTKNYSHSYTFNLIK